MPLPRLPCATALALGLAVAATPVATLGAMPPPEASDALFRGYVTGSGTAPDAPFRLAGEATASDEESDAPGWFDGNRGYAWGGAAALAAGIALAGNDGSPSLSRVAITAPAVAPTAVAPRDLGSTNVIVNPEPGTMLLMASGLAVLVLVGRRGAARARK